MIPLETEKYYHVYNHANGNELLFLEDRNYLFFLAKMREYILPVADVCAYCLMPNHFHLLLKIKDEKTLFQFFQSFKTLEKISPEHLPLLISKQFANFFSSYTQAYNKEYKRMGSLFCKNFKRKKISSESYFIKLVNYIHFNPVVSGLINSPQEWKYSSFSAIVAGKVTLVNKAEVLEWFDGIDNFLYNHQHPFDFDEL